MVGWLLFGRGSVRRTVKFVVSALRLRAMAADQSESLDPSREIALSWDCTANDLHYDQDSRLLSLVILCTLFAFQLTFNNF